MGKSAMLGSIEDALAMSAAMDMVQPCIDFAHMHARPGDGSMNTYEEWSKLLTNYKKTFGAKSLKNLHIHLSGIEYGEKGEKKHLLPRRSRFGFEGSLQSLERFRLRRPNHV